MPKNFFAPGIPDRNRSEAIPTVTKPERWKSVIHKHRAKKAGPHFDLRLLEPGTDNLHSWALRKLPTPGQKALAVQQPTHSADYIGFKGVIQKGYGAGSVGIHSKTSVKVIKSEPGKISFTRGKELFTLVKTKGKRERDWLLLNRTKTASAGGGVGAGSGGADVVALLMAGLLKGTKFSKMLKGKKV